MKEIIESVFDSMRADEALYENETNVARKRFYEITRQPLKMEVSEDLIYKAHFTVMSAIRDFLGMFFLSNIKEYGLTVASLKPLMVKGALTVEYSYMNWNFERSEGYVKTYTFTKPIKLSKLFLTYMRPDMMNLHKQRCESDNSEYSAYPDKETYLSRKADVLNDNINYHIKRVKTLLDDRSIYVYFTNHNYAQHYMDMRQHLKLSSCMSYKAEYFGSLYNGKFRHPLDGYSYSPDFRLALFSFLSPDEIRETTDYPFIGRSVVFRTGSTVINGIAYAKVYGNEVLNSRVDRYFAHIEKPVGRIFYGVVCDWYNGNHMSESAAQEELLARYEYENDIVHIIAPYIDCYNNAFQIPLGEETHFIRREDGSLVVKLEVVESYDDDDDDDDGQRKPYLAMHYSTGIVQYREPSDEVFEFFYDNEKGRWNIG